jgi:glycosyltransferase involved in cell wall biosynthesis
MRIAVNTRFLLPDRLEGFGWYTHEIMRRMVLRHPEDTFIFLFDRAFDPRFVYAANVRPIVVLPPARHPILFRIWFDWMLPRVLRREGAEVFFSPDSMCSLSSDVPTVMTCHDLVPLHFPEQVAARHRRFLLRFIPRYLRRADHILTVSAFVRQDIVHTCGIDAAKISTVYNGCREVFKPLQLSEKQEVRNFFSEGKPFFFYTGAIHPRKNIPGLIRAFDRFKARTGATVLLLLAGRFAWQTGEVRAAYEQAQHRTDIRFLGYVDDGDLARLMAAALALTYVSFSEGFGLPVLEAMYCDTPVLAAEASCLPEIAGEAALYVDPFSESSMAAGLEQLYTDPLLVKTLVEKGRQQRARFNWDKAAEETYQCLSAHGERRDS